MPNTHSTLTALFSDIADSIRSKAGTSAPIVADAFHAAIDAIPTGGGDITWDNIAMRTLSGTATGSATSISSYAFVYCKSLTTASFSACTAIGKSAFYNCSSLTTASFPVCTTISSYAFYGCTSLTSVYLPVCTSFESWAFGHCEKLTSITIPTVKIINTNAFNGCNSLSRIYLPNCSSISAYAFYSCFNLLSVYLLSSSVAKLDNVSVFYSTPISNYTVSTGGVYGSIIVPASLMSKYMSSTNWSVYSSRFSVWNGVD